MYSAATSCFNIIKFTASVLFQLIQH